MTGQEKGKTILEVKDLKKYFDIKGKGELHAVDGVNLEVNQGETLGLVGESGCGKSTVGNLIMKLLTPTDGDILFRGKSITAKDGLSAREFSEKIQIIFQDPYSSLNPRKTIRNILAEGYQIHGITGKAEIDDRIAQLARRVGIESYVLQQYPHELDGGRRQLTGIARALSLNPEFVVCDEPVSSLDVSIQATIINLLMDLQKELNLSYLFISHDLSVVKHISKRITVMYLGQVAEVAETKEIFDNAMHPYSIALLSAVPKVDFHNRSERIVLKGDVPSPINPPAGCRFAKRCWMAREQCVQECPQLREVAPGHQVACHFASSVREELAKKEK